MPPSTLAQPPRGALISPLLNNGPPFQYTSITHFPNHSSDHSDLSHKFAEQCSNCGLPGTAHYKKAGAGPQERLCFASLGCGFGTIMLSVFYFAMVMPASEMSDFPDIGRTVSGSCMITEVIGPTRYPCPNTRPSRCGEVCRHPPCSTLQV